MSEFRRVFAGLPDKLSFATWPIAKGEIFYATPLSFAFTNLKPVVPGHVLVAPKKVVARLADLSAEEIADLFVAAEFVGRIVAAEHPESDALTVTVQDGKSAGQTVPHVHVHVMPRNPNDIFNMKGKNDEIYEAINSAERAVHVDQPIQIAGRPRTEMVAEARRLLTRVEMFLRD